MDAHLTVISGRLAGQRISLSKGKFLIGREPDCQCLLDDPSVSRHHCVLILDDWALRIRDLKSKNGTQVNRSRIGTWEVVLADGDIISVGSFVARAEVRTGSSRPENYDVENPRPTELNSSDKTRVDQMTPRPTELKGLGS